MKPAANFYHIMALMWGSQKTTFVQYKLFIFSNEYIGSGMRYTKTSGNQLLFHRNIIFWLYEGNTFPPMNTFSNRAFILNYNLEQLCADRN